MSAKRMTGWQKATALVPLVLLSGAWTASLAVSNANASDEADSPKLPDGRTVPSKAIDKPANISAPGEIAPGVPEGGADEVISSASANGIPSAALAAYQRAAQVIDSADPTCKIEWPLVAAIGRVESNHGRFGGNTLNAEGVSTPGIYGIALDGSNGTASIKDTDAGQYDRDTRFDRAVGPMQFIPSTWSVVGVDGDGDGKRNPQDIDDAALATAVYLCSGDENLSTRGGQESAVYRYNHSQDYVNLVLSIMDAYAAGDYSAVPNSATEQTTFTPYFGDSVFSVGTKGAKPHKPKPAPAAAGSTGGGTSSGGSTGGSTSGGSTSGGGGAGITDPVKAVQDTVKGVQDTVTNTLTPLQKATAYCQDNLTNKEIDALGGLSACADAYLKGGAAAVQSLLDGLLGTIGGLLGGN